jgi:hypothetical protein
MGLNWLCPTMHSTAFASEFDDTFMFFTLGFLVTLLLVVPLAFVNLDNNISVTIVSCLISILMGCQWIVSAFLIGLDAKRVPAYTTLTLDYGSVLDF